MLKTRTLFILGSYAASSVGFAAAMALLAMDETDAEIKAGKKRAIVMSVVWPLYFPAAARVLAKGSDCHMMKS